VDAETRPVLHCLVYRYTKAGREYQVIPFADWGAARDEYLLEGWRFIGVDPGDELLLVRHEQLERSRQPLKRRQ
jgi:hypothetical protein